MRKLKTLFREERVNLINKNERITILEAIVHSPQNASNSNVSDLGSNKNITTISPDEKLMHDGNYQFHDEALREKAWRDSYNEFKRLMRRELPQIVYLMFGCPCAGKSRWIEDERYLHHATDRHKIIVDACNLTSEQRLKWQVYAAKATDCRMCVVKFMTPFELILKRNASRNAGKRLDPLLLEKKWHSMKRHDIDPDYEDWIDEVIFVREFTDEK